MNFSDYGALRVSLCGIFGIALAVLPDYCVEE